MLGKTGYMPKGKHAALLAGALVWVFIQLVTSGMVLRPGPASADGLHTVVICTGTELTTITLDKNGNPAKHVPVKKISCPWGAQAGSAIPSLFPKTAPPSSRVPGRWVAVYPESQTTSPFTLFERYASRAPPVPIGI